MTWAKLDDTFHHHPRVIEVSLSAKGLYALGLSFAADNLTDGRLPSKWVAMQQLEDDQTAAEQLVKAGLWREFEGGYEINDFLDRNPSREAILSKREQDAERKRQGLPKDSKRIPNGNEKDSKRTPRAPGSGSGSSSPSKRGEPRAKVAGKPVTDDELALAAEILAAFNEAAGSAYTVEAHLKPIVGRIRQQPELGIDAHRRVIAANFADPWWKDRPSPAVIYGNPSRFEASIERARGAKAPALVPAFAGGDTAEAERLWQGALADLQPSLSAPAFEALAESVKPLGVRGGVLHLAASEREADWIERRYRPRIEAAVGARVEVAA